MKKSVYLDTTNFSYYVDERAELGVHINRTREWWGKEKHLYDVKYQSFPIQDEPEMGFDF